MPYLDRDILSTDIAMKRAVEHHLAGRLSEAEAAYREIVQMQPDRADANHNLGLLVVHSGCPEAALPYLRRALSINPGQGLYALSYAEALLDTGQAREALDVIEIAIRGGFDMPQARTLRGKAKAAVCDNQCEVVRAASDDVVAGKRHRKRKAPALAKVDGISIDTLAVVALSTRAGLSSCAQTVDTLPAVDRDLLLSLLNAGNYVDLEERASVLAMRYPDSGFVWKMLGGALRSLGKEALVALRVAARTLPDESEVHVNLGDALYECGQLGEAIECYRRGLAIRPDDAAVWDRLGNVLRLRGMYQEAVDSCNRAVEIAPNLASAHNDLGCALVGLREFERAVESFRSALAISPDFAEAHSNLGNSLRELGSLDEAVDCFLRALAIRADLAVVHSNLGSVLHDLGRHEEAVASCLRALEFNPEYAEALNNLGAALISQGKVDEALASFEKALGFKPEFAEAHVNIGNTLLRCDRAGEATWHFRRSLMLAPDLLEAHLGLGNALAATGNTEEALATFLRVLEIDERSALAYCGMAGILQALSRHGDAVSSYRCALELKPDLNEAYSNLLFCLMLSGAQDAKKLFAEHCGFGERFEAPLRAAWASHDNDRDPERCLRVGFVSGDFRHHAVAFFIEPLLEHLAGDQLLTLYAYSNHPLEDMVTRRLQVHFAHWNRVSGVSDEALAQKIRGDGIDILIDLSGHTAHNRLLTFARKPAPVQVSWIGYPGTTGLRAMDYFLADRHWLPPGEFDAQFTEKIVHMPATSPFSAPADAPDVNALPALANGYVTFGSFNRANKLSRAVIALWGQLLRALPDSRMVLGGLPEEAKLDALIDWFEQEGVSRDRLSFRGRCGMVEYLGLYHEVDICLDTFPYNGGTTTLCALWMGVPTLALVGKSAAGRVAACILGHVELDSFIARDADDFLAKGVCCSGDLAALSAIRLRLRERFLNSAMGQPALAAEGVRRTLRLMWRRWCAGLMPESFEVVLKDEDPNEPLLATSLGDAGVRSSAEQNALLMIETVKAQPIYVTQPVLPPLKEFVPYLEKIWERKWLTNGGPFHQQLEQALCDYLGVKYLSLFANGTLALVTALQALRIKGEAITTPYSFVATSHALMWNGIKPIFVDIDPATFNLDAAKIEAAITPNTTAIVPAHCYGHPCDVEAIQKIADNYDLKVIYDAAHAFGVEDAGGSVLRHGDLSVLSFHATKVFNTFEGGAIVCPDAKTKQHIDHLKNFGFVDEVTVVAAGINGKMSEINAAMGLLQIDGFDQVVAKRKMVDNEYRRLLSDIPGIRCQEYSGENIANFSYFPILVESEYPLGRDGLYEMLKTNQVHSRRYFYPLISDFPMYRGLPSARRDNLPVANHIAGQVLCLPIYPSLEMEQVERIVRLIACFGKSK